MAGITARHANDFHTLYSKRGGDLLPHVTYHGDYTMVIYQGERLGHSLYGAAP
jgi:hypothetical protein